LYVAVRDSRTATYMATVTLKSADQRILKRSPASSAPLAGEWKPAGRWRGEHGMNAPSGSLGNRWKIIGLNASRDCRPHVAGPAQSIGQIRIVEQDR